MASALACITLRAHSSAGFVDFLCGRNNRQIGGYRHSRCPEPSKLGLQYLLELSVRETRPLFILLLNGRYFARLACESKLL